jgi:hypothetical protein
VGQGSENISENDKQLGNRFRGFMMQEKHLISVKQRSHNVGRVSARKIFVEITP